MLINEREQKKEIRNAWKVFILIFVITFMLGWLVGCTVSVPVIEDTQEKNVLETYQLSGGVLKQMEIDSTITNALIKSLSLFFSNEKFLPWNAYKDSVSFSFTIDRNRQTLLKVAYNQNASGIRDTGRVIYNLSWWKKK